MQFGGFFSENIASIHSNPLSSPVELRYTGVDVSRGRAEAQATQSDRPSILTVAPRKSSQAFDSVTLWRMS